MTQREAFEKWAYSQGYRDKTVLTFHLVTWQAAQANDPVKQQLVEALERISERCPTDHANYTCASVGDQARAALAQQDQPTIKKSSTVGHDISSDEFLSVRLGRVAKLVGVPMPDMTHKQIAEVAGTILGQIALKLEQTVQESVAALVEVRRTDEPWQRYNIYDSVALAENTKSRCEGGGIEVRVVPLYTHPAPTQPALSDDRQKKV